jgi:hypothetical protein
MSRTTFTPAQTQALVSLLCTIGAYVSIDIRELSGGRIGVTAYRDAFESPVTWGIALDGETRETALTPA